MSVMQKLDDNDPRVVAWNAYKAGEDYQNSFKWAEHEQHRTGSVWAAFIAGFNAHLAQPAQAVDVGAIREVIESHRCVARLAGENDLRLRDTSNAWADKLTSALSGEKAVPVDGWISVNERRPERNKPAIYWHKSEFGGFLAIADEWRDEHHLEYATHWMPYTAPVSPTPEKEG